MKKRGRIVAFFLIVLVFAGTIGTTVTGITKDINLGLDLQGGFEVLYEVETVDDSQEMNRSLLEDTVKILNDRVNKLGISEANIDIEGDDRIRVQLAGVEDQAQAREMLATSARLSFRDVNDNKLLDGSDIKEGSARQDFHPDTNAPIVTLSLKDASKFAEVTEKIKNMGAPDNRLVIWMDYQEGDSFKEEVKKENPKYESAPSVTKVLNTTDVMIEGYTIDEAKNLASIINAGSLPVNMIEKYSTSVGAQFGEQALNKTVFAGIIGVSLIFVFMLAVYRFPGIIATINLSIYIYLILLVFNLMNGVLTLPGIAALILGVGMAVDANVITFERIKEEIKAGKSTVAAFKAGTKNSLSTIFDANITTLLAASILFMFGTSSVKGFATMLIVSILVSFLTAVYGTRLLLGLWVNTRALNKKPGWFGVKQKDIADIAESDKEPEATFMNRSWNVVDYRKIFFTASTAMVIIGIVSLALFKLNPGIDFTSGSRIEVLAEQTLTTEQINEDLDKLDLEAKSLVISGEDNKIGVMRFDDVLSKDKIEDIKSYFLEKYNNDPNVSVVSPIVGEELVKNAIYAVAIASIFMIIYVTLRFEMFFAITALIALLHDAFFVLVVFSLTRIEFDVTIVAAVLTIVGYSINDTIVTFDRIRENLRKKKRVKTFAELARVVNRSLVQTFTRSLNTTVTTMLAVLAFLILGAQSITGFALALTVGLLVGTYSSLFLASLLWLVWRGKNIKEKPVVFEKKKRVEGPQV
ncbi:Protein translocase subunit SecDF [Lentibacillus sp. JNUCC-1]|uniref:protein translocase subunit SecDF n=1 Tax=Lentibacillus sp. JNUCC-1 TaxID=2654513 RepID=UPI0012E96635|nr:protein translocase subunit SecDF [Lentibacillus sp. JNUCC-1]MUV39525.1 Protein translocase subunit SecDF [Lentibacillus sp. JNUCC-1]